MNSVNEITRINHRGTEIVKIENELSFEFILSNDDFSEDYIFVSRGFLNALKSGLTPTNDITSEWHHYFVKDSDYGYRAEKIYFN
jgi:hypothetical protein